MTTPSVTGATWILQQESCPASSTVLMDISKIYPVADHSAPRYVPIPIGSVTSIPCPPNAYKLVRLDTMAIKLAQIGIVSLNAMVPILVSRQATDNVYLNVLLALGENLTC